MRLVCLATAAALTIGAGASASAAPVTEDTFLLRTTGDLVALCAADKGDPLYTAAQNYCHGFAVGTYRALLSVQMGLRSRKKWFCEPNPLPTRNEAVAGFVTWASSKSDVLAMTPTDGVFAYLQQQFPCK